MASRPDYAVSDEALGIHTPGSLGAAITLLATRYDVRPGEGQSGAGKPGGSRDSRAEVGNEFKVRIEEVAKDEVIGAVNFVVRIVPPGDCPSTLKRAAEVYAQTALKYESEAALKLVEMIGEGLLKEICQDREVVMEWKRAMFDLEVEVGRELEGQVPKETLEAYFKALEALKVALEARDLEEVMIRQEKAVEAGTEFVTGRP